VRPCNRRNSQVNVTKQFASEAHGKA